MRGRSLQERETWGSTSSKQGHRHRRSKERERRKTIAITRLMARFCIHNSITANHHHATPASAELHTLFRKYSEEGLMQVVHFHKFLMEVQQDQCVSESHAKGIMETHNYALGISKSCLSTFNEQQFVDYVFDIQSNLAINTRVKVCMGHGWFEYFGKTSDLVFLLKVGIVGVKPDSLLRKVETLEGNWVSQWEVLDFPLTVPELALLRIEVHKVDNTRKGEFMGQTCLPVSELKSGYRVVPLCDKKGNMYKKGNSSGMIRLLLHLEL